MNNVFMNPLRRSQRLVCTVLGAAAVVAGLSACAPLLIGGAAMVGGVMSVDRRTAGTQVEDEGIELRSLARIRDTLGERVHVNVTSYNRQVLVTGEAVAERDRQAIDQIMATVENVQSVVNDVAVTPITTLGERSNDTFITGKVRASLVDAKDISANSFKVVTERGIVYLMGKVSEREARRATEIARGVSGVNKVVRVFEIVTEEELTRISSKPIPPVTTDHKYTSAQ